jgi:2-phosphoglycerate kinase
MSEFSEKTLQPIYLICGVSGAGKSWVCRQLTNKFTYIPHDQQWTHPRAKPENKVDAKWGPKGSKSIHIEVLEKAAHESLKPIITEVPFAESFVKPELEKLGIKVIPIFVIEHPNVVALRYRQRERKVLPKAVFTRAQNIVHRAREWKAFYGTSQQVLDHLKEL